MTNSQTEEFWVGNEIILKKFEVEGLTGKPATHIVIGRKTYNELRQEFYHINNLELPAPQSSVGCELMGMMFSFINYDHYLAVR